MKGKNVGSGDLNSIPHASMAMQPDEFLSHSMSSFFFLLLGHCASKPLSGAHTFISLLDQFCCSSLWSCSLNLSALVLCLLFLLAFLMFLNCLYSFSCGLMNFLEMIFSIL